MADLIAPQNTVTFTINKTPRRPAERKTIERLMWMQPDMQKGMKGLQKQRRMHDNNVYIRAGVWWTDRKRATRLARAEKGASFTLQITPHIMPDLKSVEKYLDAEKA